MIDGRIKQNQRTKRTRFIFSSDGDPNVTYSCKLNDGKFEDCELMYDHMGHGGPSLPIYNVISPNSILILLKSKITHCLCINCVTYIYVRTYMHPYTYA